MTRIADLRRSLIQYGGLLCALLILVVVFSIFSDSFISQTTLSTIANNIPDLTIVAVGMTLVLILGGIDLSVGSILAFSSCVLAVLVVDFQIPLALAMLACVMTGLLCGLFNGLVSVYFKIPSFIVTLGMFEMARGGAYLVTDSQSKYIGSQIEWMGESIGSLGVSPAFIFAIAIVFLGQLLLHRTVLGKIITAIGTNAETVRMSGVSIMPYSVAIFSISGAMCGLGAIMQTSRLSTADPNAGTGLELSAIAACVIGGTSLRGGHGSVIGTFFGVLIVSVLQKGLLMWAFRSNEKNYHGRSDYRCSVTRCATAAKSIVVDRRACLGT